MNDNNNAPERIELPNGWKIEVERNEICEAAVWLIDPNDCVLMHGAMMQPELFAAAMQPQVSEGDEAVREIVREKLQDADLAFADFVGHLRNEYGRDGKIPHNLRYGIGRVTSALQGAYKDAGELSDADFDEIDALVDERHQRFADTSASIKLNAEQSAAFEERINQPAKAHPKLVELMGSQPTAVSDDAVERSIGVKTALESIPRVSDNVTRSRMWTMHEYICQLEAKLKEREAYGDACRLDGARKMQEVAAKLAENDMQSFKRMAATGVGAKDDEGKKLAFKMCDHTADALIDVRNSIRALSPETVCGGE